MGLGNPGLTLAWAPKNGSVLALSVSNLIQQPTVLLGAAAVVVVAVLIVLIMVLRGGSKKAELAPEAEEDQEAWEPPPRGAANQAGKGYDSRDQMLPWEQGNGANAAGDRQQMGGRRGAAGRDAPAEWSQADGYEPHERQWEPQGQPAPRGGQWVGTDEWAPPAPQMGRNGPDQRAQAQMEPREQEAWGWGAGQAPAGGQNANQWGQGAAAMSRENEQWGQKKPVPPPSMGRENDQWGQSPVSPAIGREADQWGQGPAMPAALDQQNDQWGQGPGVSHPRGREDVQWGQGPGASYPPARENDQWGQGDPMRGRGQDQWGQGPGAAARGMGQPEDQRADPYGGPRRGPEPVGQPEGQWKQGGWGQGAAGWEGGGPADQWGQSPSASQSPQTARPVPPVNSRPIDQRNAPGQAQPIQEAGADWSGRDVSRPVAGSSQPGSGWSEPAAPAAWQAEPRQEAPSWEAPGWRSPEPEPTAPRGGPRSQPSAQPSWEQAGRAPAEPSWQGAGAIDEWGQSPSAPKAASSRPVEPSGARGMSQPPASGDGWSERDFERPTARPAQAPPWQAAAEPAAPAWQPPAPQMAAAPGPVEAPVERRAPDMRQIAQVSPDSTAYAPPAAGGAGEGDKTVVMRKDAGAVRLPAVVVRQGKEPGRTYDVRKDHLSIGRSRDSDIFLEDLAVSRLHATIYRDEMGGYLLRDENSANGTSVNGQRVTECALQEGDEIQLGQTILAFVRHS